MMILINLLIVFQLCTNVVLSQRDFPNPAVTDPAPCACDLLVNHCDPNCCCDPDCTDSDLSVSPVCNSIRTVSSCSSCQEASLATWNCSNTTSAALYDYFPFVCVQLTLNEIVGNFSSTSNVTFITTSSDATNLRSTFITQYPDLFQPVTLSSPITKYNSIGAPVRLSSGSEFTLPGNLVGFNCQNNVPVLFGVNRDVSCSSTFDLCALATATTSVSPDGQSTANVTFSFSQTTYTPSTVNARSNSTAEYYFQDSYNSSIDNIASTSGSINDYCLGRHPLNRTQRYSFCASSNTNLCPDQYQTYSGCPEYSLQYSTIPDSFFTALSASIDGSTNFADFDNSLNVTSVTCSVGGIRRLFYRFNYSSVDNTISTVEVFALLNSASAPAFNPRITIEWNDVASNPSLSTTIPRGYSEGEVLQFRHNTAVSDVSTLVPNSNGLCIDATRTSLRYKQSTSSNCFIQVQQQTIQQCHKLKLNMYLYLNVFYAPASDVLSYPSGNATLIQIRDVNQDSIDLDRIDETRPNNQLDGSTITKTRLNATTYTIYDTTQNLPVCYNVPSGIYVEFGFVRIHISPTISYERIVSVQYNYTYSNWQFDCTTSSCSSSSTQQYLVSFQSSFVDYTNLLINLTDTTRTDLTSADNYIQHLLWLISPEYNGEPGYRNYTIAMILIFIAISIVVMHVQLFGIMCPF